MSKNVAVFVDVANIFYAAKAAGVDIDYVTLLKTASAGRDLVRAYAYTGLDPDNDNQRNFHDFLRRHGYKVVSKDIRKYGDGKVKANLDIELVVDMMKTARNLDIAIVISGDGDFAPAIRAVQEMGVRVEVISFRGNTSSDLIEVADQFTEITQIAKVEKGSSRSGRRVAEDEDEDLSMTEVPDKLSEGTGPRRGRGRGRGRAGEAEPAVAARTAAPRGRARVAATETAAVAAVTASGVPLVVLPGEKLSRVAPAAAAIAAVEDVEELEDVELGEGAPGAEGEEAPRRRRRRRGGRGRGRGRGLEGAPVEEGHEAAGPAGEEEDEEEELVPMPAPKKPAAHAFGSVWDSQIGIPAPSAGVGSAPMDEDFDEPPIPEYLIAERKQRDGRRPGGAGIRGARSGYSAAVDRERFGGGRGGGTSRFAEPAPRGGSGGGNRGREADRFRTDRPAPRQEPRFEPRPSSSSEPWSEVPPEIEAMLRSQLGSRAQRPAPAAPAERATTPEAEAVETPRRRATRRPTATVKAEVGPDVQAVTAPAEAIPATAAKKRAPRTAASKAGAAAETVVAAPAPTASVADAGTPKRRTVRKATAKAETPAPETAAAPKRRAPRKQAPAADA